MVLTDRGLMTGVFPGLRVLTAASRLTATTAADPAAAEIAGPETILHRAGAVLTAGRAAAADLISRAVMTTVGAIFPKGKNVSFAGINKKAPSL